jgi:SAM-dependent methyltransferase
MNCHICGGYVTDFFTSKNSHDIFRCKHCDLLFVHPIPVSTSEIYEEDYFSGASHGHGYVDYDTDKGPMIPVFKKYLLRIEESLGRKGKLLDVGAATGFFVNLARDAKFDAHGIEISDHAAAIGRSKGLDIQTGTLADISDTFDCITMLDVIEHVPNPRAEIERAFKLLNPGGILIINTPDAGSLFARSMGKRWHLIVPPEHLFYFSRRNLRSLLEQVGFNVLWVGAVGKSFTLPYIFKTLYSWQKLYLLLWLWRASGMSFVKHISLPINLRDNLFLIARKVA